MKRYEINAMSTLGLSVEVLLRVTNLRKGPSPITSFDVVIRNEENYKLAQRMVNLRRLQKQQKDIAVSVA